MNRENNQDAEHVYPSNVYPANLKRKVEILSYFINYFREQNLGRYTKEEMKNLDTKIKMFFPFTKNKTDKKVPKYLLNLSSEYLERIPDNFEYPVSFIRTEDATLIYIKGDKRQINFRDGSKFYLEKAEFFYERSDGVIRKVNLRNSNDANNPEILDRVTYTKKVFATVNFQK